MSMSAFQLHGADSHNSSRTWSFIQSPCFLDNAGYIIIDIRISYSLTRYRSYYNTNRFRQASFFEEEYICTGLESILICSNSNSSLNIIIIHYIYRLNETINAWCVVYIYIRHTYVRVDCYIRQNMRQTHRLWIPA